MRRGVPLRESVLGAFTRILGHARSSARRAASDPVEAVHDFRKSVRRARALIALLRPSLGQAAAEGISTELRQAFGATGALRDAHILLETLRAFPAEDPARAEIERRLEAETDRGAPAGDVLAAGARLLQPLPGALRVTLPRSYSMEDLARGLARGFRRQRRALARACETGLEADFHGWRKRVKELRYQVELLASTGSVPLRRREKEMAALAEELGRVTDLIVLHAELELSRARGGIPEAAGLFAALRESIGSRARALLARGQELFAETPEEFARRVLADRG
jgi:CHAD domain-containing protein